MLAISLGLICQTLVGASYQFPAVTVAPGQVIPFIVTGLQTVLPGKVEAQAVPLPVNLAGISLTLHQSLPEKSWNLPLFSVEQINACQMIVPTPACLRTAITAQVPLDISVPNPLVVNIMAQGYTTLTVSENGSVSQTFLVQPVYDRVHILQSCDIGGQTEGAGICYPLVTHADGSLVLQDVRSAGVAQTHVEAQPGETLVMYAYGLGTVTPAVPIGVPSPAPAAVASGPFYVRYDYVPNAAPMPVTGGSPASLPFVGLTPGQSGLYQINFVVPPAPAGTQPCGSPVQSNMTVSILAGGSGSFDGAALCVDPGAAAP